MEEGIIATSYTAGDKFYIDPAKLLPLSRFLPQPKYDIFSSLSFWHTVFAMKINISISRSYSDQVAYSGILFKCPLMSRSHQGQRQVTITE